MILAPVLLLGIALLAAKPPTALATYQPSPNSDWPRRKIPFASAPRLVCAVGAFGGHWALAGALAAGPA